MAYFDLNVEKNYVKESEIQSDMHQKIKDTILGLDPSSIQISWKSVY